MTNPRKPLTVDDPRHGTDAGAQAHYEEGQASCEPCRIASARATKAAKLRLLRGERRRVPLGEKAWRIVHETPRGPLRVATGIRSSVLSEYDQQGPERVVHVDSQRKILAAARAGLVTVVGLQRRLQALSAIGYAAPELAARTGANIDAVKVLRRGSRPRKYVQDDFTDAICRVYTELHMTPAPRTPSSIQQRAQAARRGWLPPLAFDTIDNPAETPNVTPAAQRDRSEVDPVVVLRILSGERMPSTPAEKTEVARRWFSEGRSLQELERIHGWKVERYYKPTAQAVAS